MSDLSDFQIRLREPEFGKACEALERYMDGGQWMLFRHEPNADNVHWHCYTFGRKTTCETIRKHIASFGYDKSAYMVGKTAGRKAAKITPMIAYQYAMNPKSKPQLAAHHGWTEENLAAFALNADEYYKAQATPLSAVLITKEEHYVVKPDRVWERLRSKYETYADLNVKEIKSKLAAEWLNAGKAIMRSADAHRYAVSLYMLNKYKIEVPDNALYLPDKNMDG